MCYFFIVSVFLSSFITNRYTTSLNLEFIYASFLSFEIPVMPFRICIVSFSFCSTVISTQSKIWMIQKLHYPHSFRTIQVLHNLKLYFYFVSYICFYKLLISILNQFSAAWFPWSALILLYLFCTCSDFISSALITFTPYRFISMLQLSHRKY